MNEDELVDALWNRAKKALEVARHNLSISPESAASKSYYVVFYAASALFALKGQTFRKHSALEAAVHRELVKTGIWPTSLGEQYSRLMRLRNVSDYMVMRDVTPNEAQGALESAEAILRAVAGAQPEIFTGLEEEDCS